MTWDNRWPICGRPHDMRCKDCTEADRPCYCEGRDD